MGTPQPSLKSRALRLLALREHSRIELERRLAGFEQTPGELAAALDLLQAKGFINEGRVLESVLHRRADRLGHRRIAQELQQRGLTPEAIADGVAHLKETETARARAVHLKKFGEDAPTTPADRARQMRFLLARGFAPEAVRRALGVSDDGTP